MANAADRRRSAAPLSAALAAMGFVMAACGPAEDVGVMVYATASMADPMQRLVDAFTRENPGAAVQLHCAGTPHLLMQLREGAVADVIVAADDRSMAQLGVADSWVVATNELAIVVAAGNPKGITGLADLARPDLLVALCGPEVPAGRYARAACRRAGVEPRSVSDEPNVRALLAKVRLGELDAGVVYATDVGSAAIGVTGVAIPAAHNVRANYPVAVLSRRPEARLFGEFLRSDTARAILQASGFGVP